MTLNNGVSWEAVEGGPGGPPDHPGGRGLGVASAVQKIGTCILCPLYVLKRLMYYTNFETNPLDPEQWSVMEGS